MAYRSPNEQKSRFPRDHPTATPAQAPWLDDRIPPLVSISAGRDRPNDKNYLDSLNQSEVRSIYTVDKEETDRHTLDILNKSFKSTRPERTAKPTPPDPDTALNHFETPINRFETPILAKEFEISRKEEDRTPIANYEELNEFEYRNCPAVQLYRSLVEAPLKENTNNQEGFQFEWHRSKNAAELLANVLTNPARLRLYLHYLLREIHSNEQRRLINHIHQEELHSYDPNLKEAYSNIVCLLTKLALPPYAPKAPGLEVAIFESGISIDVDPKCSQLKRRNNERIRELRHQATEQENQLRDTKKLYEEIIENYTAAIENLSGGHQEHGAPYSPPAHAQSRVQLELEEDEPDPIRRKNHTFGMKQLSSRSSRQ